MFLHGVFAVAALACLAPAASAQHVDSVEVDTVVPGVVHRHLVVTAGPWNIHVIEVNLRDPHLHVEQARADGQLRGRETVADMVRDHASKTVVVVAAVNADFFDLKTGRNENNQVIDGEIWQAASRTEADSARYVHSQLAILAHGRPAIAQAWLIASVSDHRRPLFSLDGVNERANASQHVLYTTRGGAMTPFDSTDALVDLPLQPLPRRGDTLRYIVTGAAASAGTTLLAQQAALSIPRADPLASRPAAGDTVTIAPFWVHLAAAPRLLTGGWPRLVVHGQSIVDSVDRLEGTTPAFAVTRHPRTGIGMSRDSATLYLITVDGRQESSSGMSLAEFARLMLQLGVYEGLNLDGGGSTTMVIDGRVVNHPSDPGGERAVGNALLITRRK